MSDTSGILILGCWSQFFAVCMFFLGRKTAPYQKKGGQSVSEREITAEELEDEIYNRALHNQIEALAIELYENSGSRTTWEQLEKITVDRYYAQAFKLLQRGRNGNLPVLRK